MILLHSVCADYEFSDLSSISSVSAKDSDGYLGYDWSRPVRDVPFLYKHKSGEGDANHSRNKVGATQVCN